MGKVFGIVFLIVGMILIAGFCLVKRLFFHKYYRDLVLVDDFLITPEWKTLEATKTVAADKDINFISIGVALPFEAFSIRDGIKSPEGTIINPEIILVDMDGVEYDFARKAGARRYQGYDFANYKYDGDLPRNKKFTKILLRSSVPIPTTRIQWSGYNIKDLP